MSMSKFIDQRRFEPEFFLILAERIKVHTFSQEVLGEYAGLLPPNDFTIDDLKAPLTNGRFPLENFSEYCWGITESFDRLAISEIDDNYFLLYITSLYLYCNSKEPFGVELSGFYIEKCITDFFVKDDLKGLSIFQYFLESLNLESNICVKYFVLLGMLFIGRALNKEGGYLVVYKQLEEIRSDNEDFDDLIDDSCSQEDWQRLDAILPIPEWGGNMDFSRIIFL